MWVVCIVQSALSPSQVVGGASNTDIQTNMEGLMPTILKVSEVLARDVCVCEPPGLVPCSVGLLT